MAGKDVSVRIVSNSLTGALQQVIRKAVRDERVKVAHELEADWKRSVPVESGAYRGSIHTIEDASPTTSVVTTNLPDDPYDIYLEYGTGKMAPRRPARRAAARTRPKLPGRVARAVKDATR